MISTLNQIQVDYLKIEFNSDDGREEFGERVYERALTLAKNRFDRGSENIAHDIAMNVFFKFWENPEDVMSRYEPEVYAAVSINHRANDWFRSERIQRGEGARLNNIDGRLVAGREVISLNQIDDYTIGSGRGRDDMDEIIVEYVDLKNAINVLTDIQRKLLFSVDVFGNSMVKTAEGLGLNRKFCQREIEKARAIVRDFVAAA